MKNFLTGLVIGGALVALSVTTQASRTGVVQYTAVYGFDGAALAASALESSGNTVLGFIPDGYYPTGEDKVIIFYRGYGAAIVETPTIQQYPQLACMDYDAATPGIQGPYPGATCYVDPNTGVGGWR